MLSQNGREVVENFSAHFCKIGDAANEYGVVTEAENLLAKDRSDAICLPLFAHKLLNMKPGTTVSLVVKALTCALVVVGLCLGMTQAMAKPRSPAPPLPELAPVLWSESFDELYSYGMTNAQLSVPNGALRESWTGYALQRSGILSPFIIPAREANGHTNVMCGSAGTLRFWIKPYWSSATSELGGTGPGTFARLAELTVANEPQAVWSLQASPDGSTLSLLAQGDAGPTELLSAPIAWRAGVYHLVCLSYGPRTVLYLDGRPVAEGAGTLPVPASLAQLVLGSNLGGTCAAEADFDEVYSFGRPLAVDQVGFYYQATRSLLVMDYFMTARERKAQLRAGDTALSLTVQASTLEIDATDVTMAVVPPPFPGDGGGDPGTNDVPVPASLPKYVDGSFALLPPVFTDSNTLSLTITNFQAEGNQFDLFYTTNLALLPAPALCLTNWAYLYRGDPDHTNFPVINAPQPECYFRIGTLLDSDGDSLTDAYEALVSHTDPHNPDTDGDGFTDGWEVANRLDPRLDDSAQPGSRINYIYDGTGWLETISGAQNGVVGLDPEGNVLQVSQ